MQLRITTTDHHHTVQVDRVQVQFCASRWIKKHHQHKLQRVIPPHVQVDYLRLLTQWQLRLFANSEDESTPLSG